MRQKIADYLNDLVSIGVKGFRMDASKHMWPGDLEAIQSRVNDVNGGGRPLFFHEVKNINTYTSTLGLLTYSLTHLLTHLSA